MLQRSLCSLPLLFLAACTSAQEWTAILTPDGVQLEAGVLKPEVELDGVFLEPRAGEFMIWEGQTLFTGTPTWNGVGPASWNGDLLPEGGGTSEGWSTVRELCIGEGTVWGRQWKEPGSSRVVRLDGQGWTVEAEDVDASFKLTPRLGEEPVLLDESTGTFYDLDGEEVGALSGDFTDEVLFAGGVLMEVHGWVDTSEAGQAEVRQHRIVGPECEALLAGQLVAYIPSAQGLETLSAQGVMLHREQVLPDCQVVSVDELYHPEKNFWPQASIQAGDHAWAYWSGL